MWNKVKVFSAKWGVTIGFALYLAVVVVGLFELATK